MIISTIIHMFCISKIIELNNDNKKTLKSLDKMTYILSSLVKSTNDIVNIIKKISK